MIDKRIRLLLTISDLGGGGAERGFVNLLRYLNRSVFDIYVCLWREATDYPPPNDLSTVVLQKNKPWHLFRTIKRLAQQIDIFRPDVVFSVLQYPNLITGSSLYFSNHKPRWVCRFVSAPETELAGWKRYWARCVVPRADMIIGCSNGVCEALKKVLCLPPEKILMLPSPVDLDSIERLSGVPLSGKRVKNKFSFLHVGRFSPEKNQRLLIEAFAASELKDAELWMLGRGPLESSLRKLAKRLGLDTRIHWLGFQQNPYPFFRYADAFVLSSNREGFPTVLVEAMACGTPVISTNCNYGPEELIADGKSGLLVPVNSVKGLAEAMQRVAGDAHFREKIATCGQRIVRERYADNHVLERYQKLFLELGGMRS